MMICRKTMEVCAPPGMCSPHGGCRPEHQPSDEIRKLEKERDYWRRVAAYLASCHAATLEYDGSLKGLSRVRKDRFINIAKKAANLMEGRDGELGLGYARGTPEEAACRCRSAILANGGEV